MPDHPEKPGAKTAPMAGGERPVAVDQYPRELSQQKAVEEAANLLRRGIGRSESETLVSYGLPVLNTAQNIASGYVERQNAFYPPQDYLQGAGDAMRREITQQTPRLPPIPAPTKVGLFAGEDSSNSWPYEETENKNGGNAGKESEIAHAYSTASVFNLSYQALSGNKNTSPVKLLNRSMLANVTGWHLTKPLNHPHSYSLDSAAPFIRKTLDENTCNVFSISQTGKDTEMRSVEDYNRLIEKIDDHNGANAFYFIANGNNAATPTRRHNALHHHPRTIAVGATHEDVVQVGDRKIPVRRAVEYNEPGADIVCAIPNNNPGYAVSRKGAAESYALNGTSFAAPAAAAGAGYLLQRFAHSRENPEAVLTPETVMLAIKQTAQPVTVIGNGETAFLIPLTKINGRIVSGLAGNGQADFESAWQLLDRMEKRVRDTQAAEQEGAASLPYNLPKAYVRARIPETLFLQPELHQENGVTIKNRLNGNSCPVFEYVLRADSDLFADTVLLHLRSQLLSDSRIRGDETLFLISPHGDRMGLNASAHGGEMHPNKNRTDIVTTPCSYMMARVPGLQGVPLKGEWKIVSSQPLDEIVLSFPDAMQKDDVGMVVTPSRKPSADLYRHADLRQVSAGDLDRVFLGKDFLLGEYDFSATAFPNRYMEKHLALLIEQSREAGETGREETAALYAGRANRLLQTGYPGFRNPQALAAAIENTDPRAAIHNLLLTPDTEAERTPPAPGHIANFVTAGMETLPVFANTPATTQPSGGVKR